jgi:hypothetical protein
VSFFNDVDVGWLLLAAVGGVSFTQVLPCVNARVVPIAPCQLNGVHALLMNAEQGKGGGGGVAHSAGVSGGSHEGVPPFTHNAGADGAEAIVGVGAGVAVCPTYVQGAGGAVGGDAGGGGAGFVHN